MVHSVSDRADFDNQLEAAGDKLVVVDFYATWCGPCKVIAPKLDEMSNELKDSVVFLKEIAIEYKINAMPTFIFIKNKQKVDEFCGANETKVRDLVNKLIKA